MEEFDHTQDNLADAMNLNAYEKLRADELLAEAYEKGQPSKAIEFIINSDVNEKVKINIIWGLARAIGYSEGEEEMRHRQQMRGFFSISEN